MSDVRLRFGVVLVTMALILVACGSSPSTSDSTISADTSTQVDPTNTPPPTVTDGIPEENDEIQEVVIGHVEHLTGAGAESFGIPINNGIMLALNDVQESGYLSDVGVELILQVKDDATDAAQAVTVVNEFIDDGVPLIIQGAYSAIFEAIRPFTREAEVALISAGSGGNRTDEDDFDFRVNDTVGPIQNTAFRSVEAFDIQRPVAIVDNNHDAFVAIADQVEKGLQEAGLASGFIRMEIVNSDTTNFSSVLLNLERENPDFLLLSMLPAQGGNVIVQMARDNIMQEEDIPTMSSSGGLNALYTVAGPLGAGVYQGVPWAIAPDGSPADPVSDAFAEAYMAAYGEEATSMAANGYDTLWIVATAIRMAAESDQPITGSVLRELLPEVPKDEGFVQRNLIDGFAFDENGAPTYDGMAVTLLEDGKQRALLFEAGGS